jgi:NifB/MoaA-like Fe-S oxidoreductase
MLNDDNVFLDDLKVEDLQRELNAKIIISDVDGEKLLNYLVK